MLALADACSCEEACASAGTGTAKTATPAPRAATAAQRSGALDRSRRRLGFLANFDIEMLRAPATTQASESQVTPRFSFNPIRTPSAVMGWLPLPPGAF